jgi:sugar phosphate isomerase/epimerase
MTGDAQLANRIGTMVRCNQGAVGDYIRQILPHGFESLQLMWWQHVRQDLARLAEEVSEAIGAADVTVPTLAIFGNPLEDGDLDRETRDGWVALIDNAHLFGAGVVAGFTGRLRGQPLPDSLPRFREIWSELAKRAADRGVRIAFENCPMDGTWESGDWNIAHTPAAWEMMFNAVPDPVLGLEWEPCHQLCALIDPLPQLRVWTPKIFHVHGKDATVRWDVVRTHGIHGGVPFAFHRTPGFGDTNWTDVISALRLGGYRGTIDIEGWHDPVYCRELEMTGQVRALHYLKQCRGGDFVPNPV